MATQRHQLSSAEPPVCHNVSLHPWGSALSILPLSGQQAEGVLCGAGWNLSLLLSAGAEHGLSGSRMDSATAAVEKDSSQCHSHSHALETIAGSG